MKLKLLLFSTISLGLGLISNAQEQQFTTIGAHTFTIPSSVIGLRVECIGAGGAGGRVTPSNFADTDAGGGGGGGAYARSIVPVTAGVVFDLFVGKGGKNDGSSLNGEDSYFGNPAIVKAEGGQTRNGNDNEAGVDGGQAANSIGDVTYSGGKGGNGDESDSDGGGGGGAAGSTGNGINGSNLLAGGNTQQYGGSGGAGGPDGANGQAGNNYGGGGGGSSANGSNDRNGGAGANGFVVVKWTTVDNIAPTLVCATANETVTITGTNFTSVDSVLLNGQQVAFNVLNTTTIEATIDTSLHTGRLLVYSENGIAQSDSVTITRNTVTLTNNMNSLTATYTGDALAANWFWYDCVSNDTINTDSVETLTVPAVGVYGVYVQENGCIIQSACVVVNQVVVIDTTPVDTSTTAIRNNINNEMMSIFPNPSNGKITIKSTNNNPINSVNIFDITGSLVFKQNYTSNLTANVNINHLNAGVYIVEVLSNKQKSIVKLIKK